ncbi:class I SAM-dependent methyltransferase [Aestuariivita sp.]|jgi:trans-aconitate methyltransferase|uniref:class I SAM-dependent methyltransferase n=1 Tax=Aestuariivita sp. TaxID=1872407 RepID=UPI00216DA6BE|nr:class I SAM-dependent methyltransferase [Aestuariivita sp.]MCE8005851.1 class I SAM-dependent methyltransferase [Aestuariivita sp.]
MTAFFVIHSDLPREGPGDDESLNWALSHLTLPRAPRILDAGCGPGADIPGLLAHRPQARILALDTHAPFIDRVRARHADDPRVRAGTDDMARPDGRFDLIWTAGALYFLGVRAGLQGWRDHLTDECAVIYSELCWTGQPRSDAALAHWAQYEAMQDQNGVLADTRAAGFTVLAHRYLPQAAWATYYQPVQARIDRLRGTEPDAELTAALDAEQSEIDLWHAHGNEYGYLQVVAVPE